jgi:hypothetical protein
MFGDAYHQFPLCCLSFGQTVDERLNAIGCYSLVSNGRKLFAKSPAEQQKHFLSYARWAQKVPVDFDAKDTRHRAALFAADRMGIRIANLLPTIRMFERLDVHIMAFEKLHGRDARVRIKCKWLFDTRDGHGISYREFSVLCGLYSAIGDKELAIVTQARIRRCALGYRNAAIFGAELPDRPDKAQPLTERQLRDTIARLHRKKFFARCTVSRRITYYSIRLDEDALRKRIFELRTYPATFHANQFSKDEALTAAIKRVRQGSNSVNKAAAAKIPMQVRPAIREPQKSIPANSETGQQLPDVHSTSTLIENVLQKVLKRNP